MISEGKTNRQIATELHISEHTVKTHRSRIREKLQVNGVGQLLNRAIATSLCVYWQAHIKSKKACRPSLFRQQPCCYFIMANEKAPR